MASLETATLAMSRERGLPRSRSIHTPADVDTGSITNGGLIRNSDENRVLSPMPKGLGGMLKTTTETGNVGLFSSKPSRVPLPFHNAQRVSRLYNEDAMRRPRQSQPYGVSSIDDRRLLPSYAGDSSSEVISVYETASQKSVHRVFDDTDNRSYSMTQACSPYLLSKHRSYASLRSPADAGGHLQRPRSPFAYPTRLKRPGFRPSSPPLTDGGAGDYSRRAKTDQTRHVSYSRTVLVALIS